MRKAHRFLKENNFQRTLLEVFLEPCKSSVNHKKKKKISDLLKRLTIFTKRSILDDKPLISQPFCFYLLLDKTFKTNFNYFCFLEFKI